MHPRPAQKPSDAQAESMMAYFDEILAPKIQAQIDKLTGIFQHIRLSEESYEGITYPIPGKNDGIF